VRSAVASATPRSTGALRSRGAWFFGDFGIR
jgi:hypothetical protein